MASFNQYKPLPKNELLVNAIQLSPDDQQEFPEAVSSGENDSDRIGRIKEELHLNLDCPLRHALRSVFKNGGKVLLAFPGSSVAQVSRHPH